MTLKPALSAYLDCLRFVAAFAVLLGHMDQDGLNMKWMPLAEFSHDAVVIFTTAPRRVLTTGEST